MPLKKEMAQESYAVGDTFYPFFMLHIEKTTLLKPSTYLQWKGIFSAQEWFPS